MHTSHYHYGYERLKQQFQHLKKSVTRASFDSASDLKTIFAAIEQVEVDVGRTLLKLHAVMQVLEDKGLVTPEEIAKKADALDHLDGHQDGVLHPVVFRTEEERNRVLSPRAFLLMTEDSVETPTEFLAHLEQMDRDPTDG